MATSTTDGTTSSFWNAAATVPAGRAWHDGPEYQQLSEIRYRTADQTRSFSTDSTEFAARPNQRVDVILMPCRNLTAESAVSPFPRIFTAAILATCLDQTGEGPRC